MSFNNTIKFINFWHFFRHIFHPNSCFCWCKNTSFNKMFTLLYLPFFLPWVSICNFLFIVSVSLFTSIEARGFLEFRVFFSIMSPQAHLLCKFFFFFFFFFFFLFFSFFYKKPLSLHFRHFFSSLFLLTNNLQVSLCLQTPSNSFALLLTQIPCPSLFMFQMLRVWTPVRWNLWMHSPSVWGEHIPKILNKIFLITVTWSFRSSK